MTASVFVFVVAAVVAAASCEFALWLLLLQQEQILPFQQVDVANVVVVPDLFLVQDFLPQVSKFVTIFHTSGFNNDIVVDKIGWSW